MKYKIIFFLLFTSCVNGTYAGKNNSAYNAKGFAYIEEKFSRNHDKKILISHNKLKIGTKIRISNPTNKKFIEAIIKKKIEYDNFYKVLISWDIAKSLDLDLNFPYIEIIEIKVNKSFVAKKAITENIEKKIANKAPIAKIDINNLSKIINPTKIKPKNYSILVADFYSFKSAEILKKKLETVLGYSNYQLIYINKKNNKSYELLMGPYNTIKKLKNDYIVLNDSKFEDLDIKINE